MMKRSIVINPNGILEVLDLTLDPDEELARLHTAVGGYVQAVNPNPQTTLWLNEDGKMMELPINRAAIALWEALQPGGATTVRGAVVVTGGADANGDSQPIDPSTEALIRELQ